MNNEVKANKKIHPIATSALPHVCACTASRLAVLFNKLLRCGSNG